MKRKTEDDRADGLLEASTLTRRFASKLADAAAGLPILDVACGSGRNAILLSHLGCSVICVDKDLTRLTQRLRLSGTSFNKASEHLVLWQVDLIKELWPFGPSCVGGIINVHFFVPTLLPLFEKSLSPGGYLLLETAPGCGGNYLELPKTGEVSAILGNAFDIDFYKEGKAGPRGFGAVTVQLFARRRTEGNERLTRPPAC
jgi:SAM-dependent methyltransferase